MEGFPHVPLPCGGSPRPWKVASGDWRWFPSGQTERKASREGYGRVSRTHSDWRWVSLPAQFEVDITIDSNDSPNGGIEMSTDNRENIMQYKLRGKIDNAGNLVITESIQIPPGEVEVIVLPIATTTEKVTESQLETPKRPTKIKALQGWFEKTQPAPPDFDPDEARWEALKEKHNL